MTGSREEPYRETEEVSGADFETIKPSKAKPLVLKPKQQDKPAADAYQLEKEVQEELGAGGAEGEGWTADREAMVMKEELDIAMSMPTQALIFELRKAGVDTRGLAEKSELASELANFRLNNRKSFAADLGAESAECPEESAGSSSATTAEKLAILTDMGFADEDENQRLLELFDGNVEKVIAEVLKR